MARTIAKDHDDKRSQILATAAKVFAKDGFDRASMNSIASACGISKANIYHYYKSKDALLFDLLDGYLRRLRDQVLAADDPTRSADDRLRQFVPAVLGAYRGADAEHRVLVLTLGALPKPEQDILFGYQRELVAQLSSILLEIAPERMADKAKLRATAMSIFGMLNWYFMWSTGDDAKAHEAYAAHVADLTLNGIVN